MTLTYIDSNIWIYYFDFETPEHEVVVKKLREVLENDDLILNVVTIVEVAHYLSRRLPSLEFKRKIAAFNHPSWIRIVPLDDKILGDSIDLLSHYASTFWLGGRDAAILATMIEFNVDRIITQDKALGKVAIDLGFSVLDPLAK